MQSPERRRSLLVLGLLAPVVGAVAGLVGAIFRLALKQSEQSRDILIGWAHGRSALGFLLVVAACGSANFVAAWLVRRFAPHASGSGIPHVEAVLHEKIPPAPPGIAPVKFVGGILSIGSGLALGREGPTVQMGASLAYFLGRILGCRWPECRVLLAAGAGAGLATAFNAPLAGAIFVLEELVQKFEYRIAIAALAASAAAIAVARIFLGDAPDFHVGTLHYASAASQPLFFVFGGLTGLLAIAYNRALLATIAAVGSFGRLRVETRAGLIGGAVGILAWFAPDLVGGEMGSRKA